MVFIVKATKSIKIKLRQAFHCQCERQYHDDDNDDSDYGHDSDVGSQ